MIPTADMIGIASQTGALVFFCVLLVKFHIKSLKDSAAREKALGLQVQAGHDALKDSREECRLESEKLVVRIRFLEDQNRDQMHEVMSTCLETVRGMAEVQRVASGVFPAVKITAGKEPSP